MESVFRKCFSTSAQNYCYILNKVITALMVTVFVLSPTTATAATTKKTNYASLIIGSSEGIQIQERFLEKEEGNAKMTPKIKMLQNQTDTGGLDFMFRTGMVFWYDYADGMMYKARMDPEQNRTRTVVMSDADAWIVGLAVDWIHEHIYWTDDNANKIFMTDLEGSMKKTVVSDGLQGPGSIAVNPLNGWMYWVNGGKKEIERAGLDGSKREVIVTVTADEPLIMPYGLTLDLVGTRLYWTNSHNPRSVLSTNFDGSDQRIIFQGVDADAPFAFASTNFMSVAIFENYVYWTDVDTITTTTTTTTNKSTRKKKFIFRANKYTGEEFTKLPGLEFHSPSLRSLHVYAASKQPTGVNLCKTRGNPCSHFCFRVPVPVPVPVPVLASPRLDNQNPGAVSTACSCPDGLILDPNGLSCTS